MLNQVKNQSIGSSRRNFMFASALALTLLSACGPIIRNHGYIPPEDELANLRLGADTRESIIERLGRPLDLEVEGDRAFYYVASTQRTFGPFAPREISREVVVLSFSPAGRLSNVERFGLERGRTVRLSRRVTTDSTADISILQQLMGNLGRVDARDILNQ